VPIGATNCLNFGNPEKPEVMGQLVRAIQGMGEACAALGAPITGGNVSLYNETDGKPIFPTPVVAVVGLLEDADHALRRSFAAEGDVAYLLGRTAADLGGSELLKVVHGKIAGRPPRLDLAAEKALHELMAAAARGALLRSAHDLSDGGLAVALAECCFGGFAGEEPGLGGRFEVAGDLAPHLLLFSESPSRMIVTTRDEARLRELADRHGVPAARLGVVGGDRLVLESGGRTLVDARVAELHQAWMSLEGALAGR
jgi:phosphoribosylformylglycinamidine (FGAM) synthase-like enzyme